MEDSGLKLCIMPHSSDSQLVREVYPRLQQVPGENRGPIASMGLVRMLEAGDCDGVVNNFASAMAVVSGALKIYPGASTAQEKHCGNSRLAIPSGGKLAFGTTDMAFQTNPLMPDYHQAIQYWVYKLKRCQSAERPETCYNGVNLNDLWRKWVEVDTCSVAWGNSDDESSMQLSIPNFGFPIVLVLGALGLTLVVKGKHFWKAGVLGFGRCGRNLYADLREIIPDAFEDGIRGNSQVINLAVAVDIWMRCPDTRKALRPLVREHLLRTDIVCVKLFDQIGRDIARHVKHLHKKDMNRANA